MTLVISLIVGLSPLCLNQEKYDIVFRGRTIVDGSGTPRFQADIATRDDRIVRITSSISATDTQVTIDAKGLIIGPGFICNHSQLASRIPQFPPKENFIRQSITK